MNGYYLIEDSIIPLLNHKLFGLTLLQYQILHSFKKDGVTNLFIKVSETHKNQIDDLIRNDLLLSDYPIQIDTQPFQEDYKPINDVVLHSKEYLHVKSPEDIQVVKKRQLKQLRVSSTTFVAKHINKRVSIPFSILLARCNIQPNTLSILALLLSVIGGILLFNKNTFTYAFILFQINSLLDGCDGEVAKLNLSFSNFGKKLDVYSDYLTSFIIVLGVAVSIHQVFPYEGSWIPTGTIVLSLVGLAVSWIIALINNWTPDNFDDVEVLCHQHLQRKMRGIIDTLFAGILFFSRRDFYILLILLLAFFLGPASIHITLAALCLSWFFLSLYMLWFLRSKHYLISR